MKTTDRMWRIIAAIFCVVTGLSVVASVTLAGSASREFQSALVAAENASVMAASVNQEWRDTGLLLDEAKQLAKAGDFDAAITLANLAKMQGYAAHKQAITTAEFLEIAPHYDADASPEEDLKMLQTFFARKFPDVPRQELANGFYALDAGMRENWEAIEEFPPYLPAIEDGEEAWNSKFNNGKSYRDCFEQAAIAHQYPRWDKQRDEVITLPLAINLCREKHNEPHLKYDSDNMLAIVAYVAYESRGKPTNVVVPEDDPRALEAYSEGRKFYFSRRGQLDLACFQCHFENSGQKIRANVLSTAVGQSTHWPTYRSKWGSMGSLHRRYMGCNKQVRAKPFEEQSEMYRNLEFFHAHMSNGIPLNGPGARN